jgi:hypothetical protein
MGLRIAQLELTLRNAGLRSALNYLNSRVTYRFTTIYRLENKIFTVVETVDKLGEDNKYALEEKSFNDSLCRFPVVQGSFTSSHTAADPRLAGVPYPINIGSYTGVKLTLENGETFGTLCHYDFTPQSISHIEYHFLELAGKVIMRHLLRTSANSNVTVQH